MVPEAVGSNPISHPKQPKSAPQGILRGVFVSGGRAEFTRARPPETKTQGVPLALLGCFGAPAGIAPQRSEGAIPPRGADVRRICPVATICLPSFNRSICFSGTSTKSHRTAPSNSFDQPALHREHPQSPTALRRRIHSTSQHFTGNIQKVPPPGAVEFIRPASTSQGTFTKPHRPARLNSFNQPALHKEHPQSPAIQPTCTPINAVLCEHF